MSHIKCSGSRQSVGALTSARRKTSATLQLQTDTPDMSVHATVADAARHRETNRKSKWVSLCHTNRPRTNLTAVPLHFARLPTAPKPKRFHLRLETKLVYYILVEAAYRNYSAGFHFPPAV